MRRGGRIPLPPQLQSPPTKREKEHRMSEKSDKPPEPNRPPPDRKPPALGANVVWYLLALGVGTLFLVSLMDTGTQVELGYMDLVKLIEQGAPARTPRRPSRSTKGAAGKEQVVRYSNLDNLKIGPHEITGTVTRQVIEPEAEREQGRKRTSSSTPPGMGLENDNNDLFNLLKKKGFTNVDGEKAPSGWKSLMPMFVLTLLIMAIFFIMMRRLGGTGSAMAFGRSRGKLYAQEDIGITFNDVAGIDEAVDELREVVDFLRSPEKYQVLGGRIPKGVLLVGPPGTGKTLLAKAIAGEAGVPFFSLSGSDFVEMFVGVGAARVRDMFQQAQAKAPCIVFIDELDALGKTRGTSVVGGHDEREQTLNALLVEMDGFSSNSGVIVMAATNRPGNARSGPVAARPLRPPRAGRSARRPRPRADPQGPRGQGEARRVGRSEGSRPDHARASSGPTWPTWSTRRPCWPPARPRPAVTMDEFNEGVERVTAGLEKKQRVMHADEKQRVAYHESGHALVAYSLPNTDPVHKVSIIPRGLAALGYTMQRPEGDRYLMTQSELESRIQVLLAGTVAEEIDLRRRLDRRPERPGAGHRDRPQHGHGLRHEPAGQGELSARAAGRRFWPAWRISPASAPTASRPPARSTRRSHASSTNRWRRSAAFWRPAARRWWRWPSG